jgi:ubiquinone/menaquinone biosynthesis C-methylase UbiE
MAGGCHWGCFLDRFRSSRMDEHDAGTKATVTASVARFYDSYGWVKQGDGKVGEDQSWRRFPSSYENYSTQSAARTAALFEGKTGALLICGCGDMPESHLRIIQFFERVTCLDISAAALAIAQTKVGDRARYMHQSIVETTLPDNSFDGVFCAHVIFHIEKDQQEAAVRQLLRVVKPNGRVVIIYENPASIFFWPGAAIREAKRRLGLPPFLYFYVHPLRWWQRFEASNTVHFVPWEIIGARPARALLPGKRLSAAFFKMAAALEQRRPKLAVRLWQYPIVVLDKKV